MGESDFLVAVLSSPSLGANAIDGSVVETQSFTPVVEKTMLKRKWKLDEKTTKERGEVYFETSCYSSCPQKMVRLMAVPSATEFSGAFMSFPCNDNSTRKPRRPFSATTPKATLTMEGKRNYDSLPVNQNGNDQQSEKTDMWWVVQSAPHREEEKETPPTTYSVTTGWGRYRRGLSTVEPINSIEVKELLAPFIVSPFDEFGERNNSETSKMLALLIEPLQRKATEEEDHLKFSLDEMCWETSSLSRKCPSCHPATLAVRRNRRNQAIDHGRHLRRKQGRHPFSYFSTTLQKSNLPSFINPGPSRVFQVLTPNSAESRLDRPHWLNEYEDRDPPFAFPFKEDRKQKRNIYGSFVDNTRKKRKFSEANSSSEDHDHDAEN